MSRPSNRTFAAARADEPQRPCAAASTCPIRTRRRCRGSRRVCSSTLTRRRRRAGSSRVQGRRPDSKSLVTLRNCRSGALMPTYDAASATARDSQQPAARRVLGLDPQVRRLARAALEAMRTAIGEATALRQLEGLRDLAGNRQQLRLRPCARWASRAAASACRDGRAARTACSTGPCSSTAPAYMT